MANLIHRLWILKRLEDPATPFICHLFPEDSLAFHDKFYNGFKKDSAIRNLHEAIKSLESDGLLEIITVSRQMKRAMEGIMMSYDVWKLKK